MADSLSARESHRLKGSAAMQSRGRCKPSYADVGRLDPTIYKGKVQPALNARRNDDHV